MLLQAFVIFVAGVSAGSQWVPQYGSFKFPNDPTLSPNAIPGDVYQIEGQILVAREKMNLTSGLHLLESLPNEGRANINWISIKQGTFLWPKKIDDLNEDGIEEGMIVEKDNLLYSVKKEIAGQRNLQSFNHKASWMESLLPIIEDRRIGDLVIPGTHDSGTSGVTENSTLVDRNVLFQLAEILTPQVVANWSKTQPAGLGEQLNAGFRSLDLRIADLSEVNNTHSQTGSRFFWTHGLAGDEITEGLDEIAAFLKKNTKEILVLDFQHFAAPGTAASPTLPISLTRKNELSDLLLKKLGPYMVSSDLPRNPTVKEVLQMGANIIALMQDSYIRGKSNKYWPKNSMHSAWSSASNPQYLFEERSSKLKDYKMNYADSMTDISVCCTPDEKTVIGGLILHYGDNELVQEIIGAIAPGLLDVYPGNMSFESLWEDLLTMSQVGVNTDGMRVRYPDHYTNGASVDFTGANAMLPFWLARPDLYKVNIIYTDGFDESDNVETAIAANMGRFPRQVTIAHQGNTKDGYYIWDSTGFQTIGGTDGLECIGRGIMVLINVTSGAYDISHIYTLAEKEIVNFSQGQYPDDTLMEIYAKSPESEWYQIFARNVASMISSNEDLYIRGAFTEPAHGFAYTSWAYDVYSDGACDAQPSTNYVNLIEW